MNDWIDAEHRAERALQLSEAEQWGRALDELEAAIAINPNDPAWHAQRGHILDQLDRFEDAIEAYSQALELGHTSLELRTVQATDLIRVGRHREAVAALEKIAKDRPKFEPAYCHQIAAYTRLGEHDKAEELFYVAQQLKEDCPNCFHHLAESLACRGEFGRAIFCWQRTLEIAPDYPQARQRIAEAYQAREMPDKAYEYYIQAMRHDPGNLDILTELGHLLIEMDQPVQAKAKFEHVLDLDPESLTASVMLGLLASQENDTDTAVRYLRSALERDAEAPGVHAHLGDAELGRGNHYEARRYLTTALERDPDDCVALMAMGNCLLELGRTEEATVHYRHLIELEPQIAGAYHNLAVCRFLENDFDGGIELCEQARRIEPDNVMVLHKLALAYLHTGRWRRAREMAECGLAIEPGHAGLTSIPRTYLGFCIRRVVRRLMSPFRKK